jgi:hypothetical protein
MPPELKTALKLLVFRATSDEIQKLNLKHVGLGLLFTWLVGMGRWWEDPKADFLQHLGIGSVIYVFLLSFFLWLILWPIAPNHWSLTNVLAFISLTSPPAILYAIPVRQGMELQAAQTVRLWMLAIVAGWRVALLVFYLHRTGFGIKKLILAALFPLALIVFTLTALNLEKVVFDFMGGIHRSDRTVNDAAYGVLVMITMLSSLLFIPLLVFYLVSSTSCLFKKIGRRAQWLIFVLAGCFALSGLLLINSGATPMVVILIGSAIILLATALIELSKTTENKN